MSRRTARRQRFYHWERMNRGRPPRWFALMHSEITLDELRGTMDDAKRMAEELCGLPLISGEVGRVDFGYSFATQSPQRKSMTAGD